MLRNALIATALLLMPLYAQSQIPKVEPASKMILPTGPKNDIKITLLSLGSGSTRITYERATAPRQSAELTVGIIGLGFDIMNHADPSGILLKAAYKWNLAPMMSANSALAGFYVKPELVYTNYDYCHEGIAGHTSQTALLGECGYQLIVRWFVFDIYAGVGPAFGTGNADNYYHSFMRFPPDGIMAFTSGFRIGYAF